MSVHEILVFVPRDVGLFNEKLNAGTFVDGKATAGKLAQGKSNLQLDRRADPALTTELDLRLTKALQSSSHFLNLAHPIKMAEPRYARYGVGNEYPEHNDNPLMSIPGGTLRTDISMTVFLSEPDEYGGGELVVGGTPYKLTAGHGLIYPSGMAHHVNPVTRGVRQVAVTWIQSRVRDPSHRAILNKLGSLVEELSNDWSAEDDVDFEGYAREAESVYNDLTRMWSQP